MTCPRCGTEMETHEHQSWIRYQCYYCGKKVDVEDVIAGKLEKEEDNR